MKTLKNIEFGRTEKEDRNLLKQLAKEWIKELKSNNKMIDTNEYFKNQEKHMKLTFLSESINWIKHFFNLDGWKK